MDAFTVLAVPTRRQILELLASKKRLTATEISQNFKSTPPAISQHLKILLQAKAVSMEKQGNQRIYSLNQGWLLEFDTWSRKIMKMMDSQFDRLEQVLAENENKLDSS